MGEQNQRQPQPCPGTFSTTDLPSSNLGVSYTHIFGANTLVNTLFGYTSAAQKTTRFLSSEKLVEQGLFPGLPVGPDLNVPGVTLPSAFGTLASDNRDRGPNEGYQFRGDVSHSVNNHTLKFGGGATSLLYHTVEIEGSLRFATAQTADLNNLGRTGSDIAAFDLGVVDGWAYRDRIY